LEDLFILERERVGGGAKREGERESQADCAELGV